MAAHAPTLVFVVPAPGQHANPVFAPAFHSPFMFGGAFQPLMPQWQLAPGTVIPSPHVQPANNQQPLAQPLTSLMPFTFSPHPTAPAAVDDWTVAKDAVKPTAMTSLTDSQASDAPATVEHTLSPGASQSLEACPGGATLGSAQRRLSFADCRQQKSPRPFVVPPPIPGDREPGPRQLIVNYLALDVDSADLYQLFAPYGDVEMARVSTDPKTRRSIGFGFVYMKHHSDAEAAIAHASGRVLLGKRVRVSYAVPQRALLPESQSSGAVYGPTAEPQGFRTTTTTKQA